jgi:broad specificity phosphatase PhoE
MKLSNNYFLLRHGEAKSNNHVISSWPETFINSLTNKGKKQIQKITSSLKKKKIDLIFSSDVLRCQETAEIVARSLKLEVVFDKRLREKDFGVLNGASITTWNNFFENIAERFTKKPDKGENRRDVKKRMLDFIEEIDSKNKKKNILIVSHQDCLLMLSAAVREFSEKEILSRKGRKLRLKTGGFSKLI